MDVINDISEKYGPLTYTWLAHYPMFVVTEPDIIRDILTSPNCTNKSVVYKPFEKGIGVGILTSPGKCIKSTYMSLISSYSSSNTLS